MGDRREEEEKEVHDKGKEEEEEGRKDIRSEDKFFLFFLFCGIRGSSFKLVTYIRL